MMKRNKLTLVTKILAIIIVCLVSFAGIYVQKANKMKNIVKDYELSKDLEGYRQIVIKVSDAKKVLDSDGNVIGDTNSYDDETIEANEYKKSDERVNNDNVLNVENYEKTKNIIEKRLKGMGVSDYNLSLDKQNGTIYLQIPEDENTDRVVSNIIEKGSVEIKDSKDSTVYLTEQYLKTAKALYGTTESGTTVYLELEFNKEGTEILKDLSENEYATLPEEETTEDDTKEESTSEENTESEEETTEEEKQKEVILAISGSDVITTSFDEPIIDGKIDLSMNQTTTDTEQITESLQSASTIALLINNGALPITYTVDKNQYVTTDISSEVLNNVIKSVIIIMSILLIYMIIKNKVRGLLGAISFVGFIALYLLLLRYTNVMIALEGIVAIILVMILNYLFSMKLLSVKTDDKKEYNNQYLRFLLKLVPIFAISVVFCFMNLATLGSFGMCMFWGIVLMAIYNILITRKIVD